MDDVAAHAGEHARIAGGDRLEHEQQASRHVGVGVLVEADVEQVGGVDDPAEHVRGAGRGEALAIVREALRDLLDARVRAPSASWQAAVAHEHDVVVVGAGRELVASPGAHQHHGRVVADCEASQQGAALRQAPCRSRARLAQRLERASGCLLQALERRGGGRHARRC